VGFSASEKFFKNIFFDFELDYLKSVFFVQALLILAWFLGQQSALQF